MCAREASLLELVRSIHLNPVRAKLVADPADYRWSSHRSYLGVEAGPGIDAQPVLAQFGDQPNEARQRYREFVGVVQGDPPRPEYYQRVLGDETFKEDVERRRTPGPERPALRVRTPQALLDLVARSAGLPRARILGSERSIAVVRARRLFVQACQHAAIPGKEVATFLGRDAGLISRMGRMDEARAGAGRPIARVKVKKSSLTPSRSRAVPCPVFSPLVRAGHYRRDGRQVGLGECPCGT